MTTSVLKKLGCVGIASILSCGCVNTKMMEFTYQELDTVKTTQRELLGKVDMLSRQLEEERDARVRAEAEHSLVLEELRGVLDALSYRMEDLPQLLARRGGLTGASRSGGSRAVIDSAIAGADTTVMVDSIAPPPPPSRDDSEPDKLFKGSYMDLTLGNYDLAVQGFKNYLVRFPSAANVVDAHYYLGDSYYQLERYLEAVAEYQIVIREYAGSRFAPPAYLKAGFCYEQLGEKELAERSFRQLISRHPRTEEAEQARAALQNLGG